MTTIAPAIDRTAAPGERVPAPRLSIYALGMSLGLFLAFSFVVCVLFDLAFPGHAMYRAWAPLFPGFVWLSWSSFAIGLVESFAYGWYVAAVFAPLYNFFAARAR